MGTLVQKLQYIDESKQLIHDAIINKGGNLADNKLRSYADAITNLPSGGGSGSATSLDFSEIGYSEDELCLIMEKENLAYSKQKLDEWDPSTTIVTNFFPNDLQLVYAPKVDTSQVTNMEYMFQSCNNLRSVPLFDTSNANNMSHMFSDCYGISSVPQFDTSNVNNMSYMFSNCSYLSSVSLFDTSNVTNMEYMFNGCAQLTSVPQFDTSNVNNMSYMFSNCGCLSSVPQFDTSNVNNMSYMFAYCSSLQSVPSFNTSNVSDMSYMFSGCGLISIPMLDTSNVTNMENMFQGCGYLRKIGGLSLKSATNINGAFDLNYGSEVPIQYALLKDLGTSQEITEYNFSTWLYWGVNESNPSCPDIDFSQSLQSLIDTLLTYSYDRKTAGYSVCNIILSSNVESRITLEQKQQIEAKGYTITFQ